MPNLFEGTHIPEWLSGSPGAFMLESEKASESIGRNFTQSFNAAASRKQDQGQFDAMMPLRVQEADNKYKMDQLAIADRMLENQLKMDAAIDRTAFAAAQSAWTKGDTSVQPIFKTPQAQAGWDNWKSTTELGKKILQEISLFNGQLSKLDGLGIRAVMDKKGGGQLPSQEAWQELSVQQERLKKSGGDMRFVEDPKTGQRFAIHNNSVLKSGVDPSLAPPSQFEKLDYASLLRRREAVEKEIRDGKNALGLPFDANELRRLRIEKEDIEKEIGTKRPAQSQAKTAKEKADLANKIASEHPDWTREQILQEVNK